MCGESNTYAHGHSNSQRQRNTYVNDNTQTKHDAQSFSNSAPDSASAVRPAFDGRFLRRLAISRESP